MNETDKIELCARVKEARIRAGLEQDEIGDMLDPPVEDRTIRNYESIRPPFKYLRQWAEITGVSYDWLLRGVEPEPVVLAPETALDLRQHLESLEGQIARQAAAASDSIDALGDRLERVEDQLSRILGLLQPPNAGATEGQT